MVGDFFLFYSDFERVSLSFGVVKTCHSHSLVARSHHGVKLTMVDLSSRVFG